MVLTLCTVGSQSIDFPRHRDLLSTSSSPGRNLASKILSLADRQVPEDWNSYYGYKPVLFETFVDRGRFSGISYKAAEPKRRQAISLSWPLAARQFQRTASSLESWVRPREGRALIISRINSISLGVISRPWMKLPSIYDDSLRCSSTAALTSSVRYLFVFLETLFSISQSDSEKRG